MLFRRISMIPLLTLAQPSLTVQTLPGLFHSLLYILLLHLQKEFLPCPLPLVFLPVSMLQLTVLLFILLLHLSHPLFLFPGLLKLTLLFSYLPLLILTTPLSIFLILLVLFLRQVPWCYLEFLPPFLTLDPHFLTLFPCLLNPCLPWSLPELYLFPSLLLDLSPALGLDLLGGQSGILGAPFLGERELPGAEVKLPSPPAVRPLPSPAISGLIFNPVESPLEVPLLIVPWT